ncbi:hypothetical protein WL29_22770 [Burkholderia ubonensis]|uniref:Uncharacterized protein n=2 Tax=Burkholderia ubonensis TaxID=101571 RepID=A0A106QDG2_9BURK|nr:hypothetical protein WL29_22770 [Burkholderia ubonensis]
MTTEQRRARILELEAELTRLRAEELADPAAAERYFEKVWHDLRLGLVMPMDEYKKFLDECREIKKSSPSLAMNHFRNKMEVTLEQTVGVIKRL